MQTVYLLKDSYKSYNALKKLYVYPDLSTNIIIVDEEQAKILLLDKRVKKFPFIINTLPTNIGLIPKSAKVLPLEMFMMLKKFNKQQYTDTHLQPQNYKTEIKNNYQDSIKNNYQDSIKGKYEDKVKQFYKQKSRHKPLIKTVKDSDGGINIILNK